MVAGGGATPATIAVLDGVPHVGLEGDQLERLAVAGSEGALKLSARDLPVAMAQGATGGTTVAATALLASRAGIRVFATGGIGGVHRDAGITFDESADLGILGSNRITVVAGGVKSILDIGATLERLETLSVTVLVFGTDRFPAFWLSDSGHTVDSAVTTPEEIAEVMRASDALGLPGGILVANPLPAAAQLDPALHDRLLAEALKAADGALRPRQGHHPVPARLHPRTHGPHERGGQPRDRPRQLQARGRDRPRMGGLAGRSRLIPAPKGPQRSEFAVCSSRSRASCRPSSMPELMCASRFSREACWTRIVSVVRSPAAVKVTVSTASASGAPS